MTKQIKMVGTEMYEYELYPLVDKYDEGLREVLQPFSFQDQPYARQLAVSLIETMKQNYGVGLAANQVGFPYRVFVMGADNVGYAFFNPEILETTGESMFEEGCLSFKGLYLPIRRPERVRIKYQDMNGETKEQEFSGLSARIVLHEYDHMEGKVFTNLVPELILEKAKRKVHSNIKKLNQQREKEAKQQLIVKAINSLSKAKQD